MKISDLPSGDTVPAGRYLLGVADVKREIGKKSKTIYLKIDYIIREGEFKGRHIFDNISLSPQSLWMLKKWLMAFNTDRTGIELPIEKIDGKWVVDEEGCFLIIHQEMRGAETYADISIRPEDKLNNWPEKNEIVEYYEKSTATVSSEEWRE